MAVANLFSLLTLCTCAVLFCTASPTRRQFLDLTETTSVEPVKKAEVWNNDDFDLDGDDEWLGETVVSAVPHRTDYQDYKDEEDEEDDFPGRQRNKEEIDLDNDIEHQDAEEEEEEDGDNEHEFLFIPSKDTRLLLQDDDEQSGLIKVRLTGKNSYSESINSMESSKTDKNGDNDDQFEFTIDKDDDDKAAEIEDEDDADDFVLEDTPQRVEDTADNLLPRRQLQEEVDDDSDDDDGDTFVVEGDDPMFESPEEESQVIYGDHVFLY